jgi:hypothetical protein
MDCILPAHIQELPFLPWFSDDSIASHLQERRPSWDQGHADVPIHLTPACHELTRNQSGKPEES